MRKVKQSFLLSFVLIFAITSLSLTVTGLHLISSLHKSVETDFDATKSIEPIKVRDNIEVEVYTELPKIDAFTDEEATIEYPEDIYEIVSIENNDDIKIANKIGTYEVKVLINDDEYTSHLIIKDTIAPELELKEITINENTNYDANSFVITCQDNSKQECNISFKEEIMGTYKTEGSYEVAIVAKDNDNNITEKGAKLTIKKAGAALGTPTTPATPTNPTQPQQPVVQEPVIYVPSSSEISSVVSSGSAYYNSLLDTTNQYRAEAGLPALTLNNSLSRIATLRAIEMAKNSCAWTSVTNGNNCFSHTRPDSSQWSTAFDSYTQAHYIGENLGYGYKSVESVMQGWKDSPTHYENIVKPEFTQVGFGVYNYNGTWYWVQAFGG